MMYLSCLFSVLLVAAGTQLFWVWKARRKSPATWEEILRSAEYVNLDSVCKVAEGYLKPGPDQFKRQPSEMWALLGGLDGIGRLHHNADVMLQVAVFAEQWRHPDAALIAELIRRDAVRIKKLVTRLQFKILSGQLKQTAVFDMQEAAATYFLMRGRLIGLYQNCHVARVSTVTAAF